MFFLKTLFKKVFAVFWCQPKEVQRRTEHSLAFGGAVRALRGGDGVGGGRGVAQRQGWKFSHSRTIGRRRWTPKSGFSTSWII